MCEQGGIMVEGEMEMDIAGEKRVLRPGDVGTVGGIFEGQSMA